MKVGTKQACFLICPISTRLLTSHAIHIMSIDIQPPHESQNLFAIFERFFSMPYSVFAAVMEMQLVTLLGYWEVAFKKP